MAVALFDLDEMATAILLAGFDVKKYSPLHRILPWIAKMNRDNLPKVIRRFKKMNLIWERKDGVYELHLAYLLPMKVLADPEEMLIHVSTRVINASTTYFVRRSKTTVMYKPTDDNKSFAIVFPLKWKYTYDWLVEEITPLVTEYGDYSDVVLELGLDELAILMSIQRLLLSKLRKKAKRFRFNVVDIARDIIKGGLYDYITVYTNSQLFNTIQRLMMDEDQIYETMESMVDKGLLKVYGDGTKIEYSDVILDIMDIRKIQDFSILMRYRFAPKMKVDTLGIVIHKDKIVSVDLSEETAVLSSYSLDNFLENILKPFVL